MHLFHMLSTKNRKIAKHMAAGYDAEAQNNLEAAYGEYEQAAALGSGKAMAAIGALYLHKGFRMVEQTNIAELISQGIPVFPWNVIKKMVPDQITARQWYCKAAQCGEAAGYAAAGVMLCEGIGGSADLEKGLAYLNKALDMGVEEVRPALAVYAQAKDLHTSDEQYEQLLRDFIHAVEAEKPERYGLYSALKGGTDRQKTRLGHVLVTRRNLNDPKYADFKYLYSPEGVPLIPCCARRLNWKTFIRIDLNAFLSDDVLIAFSTDIGNTVTRTSRLTPAGSAVYRSPAFGWLRERKEAVVFRIRPQDVLPPAEMEQFAHENYLQPMEYAPDHVAFLLENGEKEYSAEIVAIAGGKVQVLFRYTIGGPDDLQETFEPELLELRLDGE